MMGSIDGPTAKELLEGQPPGTFLVRLSRSSPGDYAISYIAYNGAFEQVLINYTNDRFWLEGSSYENIEAILEKEKSLLRTPYAEAYQTTAAANATHTNRHKFQFGHHRSMPRANNIVTNEEREQAKNLMIGYSSDKRSQYAPNLSSSGGIK